MPRYLLRHTGFGAILLAIAIVASACSSNSTTASGSGTTTSPSPASTIDTFSGTVPQLGTSGFTFTVANGGTVSIALASVAPLATMALGVSVVTYDGTQCTTTTVAKNDNARAGSVALAGAATAGNYCVSVYDSGNIPDGGQASFTVQVTHP